MKDKIKASGLFHVCARITRKHLISYSILALFAGFVLWILRLLWVSVDESTYVWQSTSLAESLFPATRKVCELGPVEIKMKMEVDHPRIGVVMLYDDKDGTWNDDIMRRILRNNEKYCKRHGYTMILANGIVDKSRPPAWSKILAVQKYLHKFDYLVYLDMDVVLMNHSFRFESFITRGRHGYSGNSKKPSTLNVLRADQQTDVDIDIWMTEDWNGLNTGIWIARNSSWTYWFLREAWTKGEMMVKKHNRQSGAPYPFEYEQRVFHYLLDTPVWRGRRGLPRYDGNVDALRNHVAILPQCAFNSYSLHPFYWHGNRIESQYVHGDFLIHFAGKKGQKKKNLLAHYLDLAES